MYVYVYIYVYIVQYLYNTVRILLVFDRAPSAISGPLRAIHLSDFLDTGRIVPKKPFFC